MAYSNFPWCSMWRRQHGSMQCFIVHEVTIIHWVGGTRLTAVTMPHKYWCLQKSHNKRLFYFSTSAMKYTHPFNGPLSGTTRVSQYQKGRTNLDSTEARDSEWQWHQLGRMQVCTSLQTDKHASTPPLSFLQAGCPSCQPTSSVKALKVSEWNKIT